MQNTRRSAACDANVHFMHPECLRTGKISSDLYYVCTISGRTRTHTNTHTRAHIYTCTDACARMRARAKEDSHKIAELPVS